MSDDTKVCECPFPKFVVDDGIQSCSKCGLNDHYKNGVVADWSDDEEEEEEEREREREKEWCINCGMEFSLDGSKNTHLGYLCGVCLASVDEEEDLEECCEKCYLIECCCEADRLQVIKDDERATADGYVEDYKGRWVKKR